jgi:UDP-N-acetylglucosamine--N-acetylmuramyl-(pentapeptide) pyrophosphoryl-undecaprenol N-acetylglucosamine transferase
MSNKDFRYRFLFAGGGTGGHLYPAIAVADQIKTMKPEAEILFIGTKNKIEGTVVPKLGYKFKSIWIKGFARKFNLENLLFPLKLIVSTLQSLIINMSYKPKVAIGSGGYVSGPAIWGASVMGAKIILLEQNSYPGVTTRLLEKKAQEIHISFEDSRKCLRNQEALILTGNPVRKNLGSMDKKSALEKFSLIESKKTLLILGGSLGASSLNKAVVENLKRLVESGIQIIWQTGKIYFERYRSLNDENIKVLDFIEDMNAAYSACDLLIGRSGATTIAEILVLGIPSILVPSPNVAENHQYHNAKSLEEKEATILIEDKNLNTELLKTVTDTIINDSVLKKLSENAVKLAKPLAAETIAKSAIKFAETI